jgi:hypothetical protein
MTPDDSSIPEDDAIARAARRALDALAGGVTNDAGWDAVQVGARRVRQRRVAAVVAACAIVLAGAGAASAIAANGSGGRHSHFAGAGPSTTTDTEASTSSTTTSPTTTTIAGGSPSATSPGAVTPPTTTTIAPPIAQAGDLSGTLAPAGTTVVAEQPTGVFLTVQNTSGHAVSLSSASGTYLGVAMQGYGSTTTANADVVTPPATLAAGETRTFGASITPPPEMVGAATISAAFIQGYLHVDAAVAYALSGVPPVAITVVPPGTTPGQPLDPSLGKWTAVMSADATEVTAGGTVAIHAQLTNTGDQTQNTQGYGSLVIACGGSQTTEAIQAEFIGAATLAPGETQSFSLPLQSTAYSPNPLVCWFGIAYHANPADVARSAGITTDTVQIAVLDAGSTTTSTAPDPAAPTTSP